MKNKIVILVAALIIAALGLFWFVSRPGGVPDSDLLAGADIDVGQGLYQEFCASCHGARLQGQPDWQVQNADGTFPAPPHDETGHTWHHDDALLFAYTQKGGAQTMEEAGISDFASGMPGFGDQLTDQQIRDVLAFIASKWPDRIQQLRKERNAQNPG